MIQEKLYKSILVKFERKIGDGKKKLPSKCRIGETIFTSMDVIGGKLYSNHRKNLNHVHKGTKYLVSVIITLGKIYKRRGHCVL